MITIAVGLALTTVLISAVARRAGQSAADMGSMSVNWVAANRAGERGSSL